MPQFELGSGVEVGYQNWRLSSVPELGGLREVEHVRDEDTVIQWTKNLGSCARKVVEPFVKVNVIMQEYITSYRLITNSDLV